MSLERVVRPFQQGDVFTARRGVPTPVDEPNKISTDTPVLTIKGKNDGKYTTEDEKPWTNFTTDLTEDTSKRETVRKRIENPDDSDQYVMVERLVKATFRDDKGGKQYNLSFGDWEG